MPAALTKHNEEVAMKHLAALALVAASALALGFFAGMMFVIDNAYDSAKEDMLQQLRHDMRVAVMDNRPFYLVGSNIRLIPRGDGNMNVRIDETQIAGAGDEGVRRVWR